MRPIRELDDLRPGRVLYHSAFGFARVVDLGPNEAKLSWSKSGDNLPRRVNLETLRRVYAACRPNGFFERALTDLESLQETLHFDAAGALALLLADLPGKQGKDDLREWLVERDVMSDGAFDHWWNQLQPQLPADPRFVVDGDVVGLHESEDDAGVEARLRDMSLAPRKRLDLALANRPKLDPDFFRDQVLLAWRTGGQQVRDMALNAVKSTAPDTIVAALLAPGPESVESIVHAIRRGGWKADSLSPGTMRRLHERIEQASLRGGPVDSEGRLAAALLRWGVDSTAGVLAAVAGREDGQRLIRATMSALPPRRAEALTIELLAAAVQMGAAAEATHWLAGEVLEQRAMGADELALELQADNPALAAWFSQDYDPFFEDDWDADEGGGTTEIEVDWLTEAVTLAKAPVQSGANVLSVAEGMARALVISQKAGEPVNPTSSTVAVRPDGTVEITGTGEPGDSPRPLGEGPSLTADVYAMAVLLIESVIGRDWPRALPAAHAMAYLRHVAPALPASLLGPLLSAVHSDPAKRPADAVTWLDALQKAVTAEDERNSSGADADARLLTGYDSHIGRVKVLLTQTNQDAIFAATRDDLGLLVVCDGISTATAGSGDVASGITAHVIAGLWEQSQQRLREASAEETFEFLERSLRMANQAVCEAALRLAGGRLDGKIPMGTTAIVAVTRGNRVSLAWQGDSRAYLVGDYGAALITADQNQAGERFAGWVAGAERSWDPNGYALVGYIGHFNEYGRPEPLLPQQTSFLLLPGERLVLCTDGVTDYIADHPADVADRINEAAQEQDLDDIARSLIRGANKGGGGDNTSAVVARLR